MPVVSDYTALLGNGFGTWNLGTRKATFVSYTFPDSYPVEYVTMYGLLSGTGAASFQTFTTAEKDLIRAALDVWAAASGIHFIEVAGNDGDIRFSKYNMSIDFGGGVSGFGMASGRSFGTLSSSDVAYNGDVILDHSGVNMRTVLHEIGHVIGLKHTFDGATTLDPAFDTAANTVMGYSNVGFNNGLGVFDVQALDFLEVRWDNGSTQIIPH